VGGRVLQDVQASSTSGGTTPGTTVADMSAGESVQVQLTLSGDASDFSDTQKSELKQWAAQQLNIAVDRLSIVSVRQGSVVVEMSIDMTQQQTTPQQQTAQQQSKAGEVLPLGAIIGMGVGGLLLVVGIMVLSVVLCRSQRCFEDLGDATSAPADAETPQKLPSDGTATPEAVTPLPNAGLLGGAVSKGVASGETSEGGLSDLATPQNESPMSPGRKLLARTPTSRKSVHSVATSNEPYAKDESEKGSNEPW